MILNAVRRFDDQHVHLHIRDLCLRQMSIYLPAEISSVQHANAANVDHEHRCTEDMTSTVARKLDAFVLPLLMVVYELDSTHGRVDISGPEDLVFRSDLADAGVVVPQHSANRPRGMGHEDLSLELRPIYKVGHRT